MEKHVLKASFMSVFEALRDAGLVIGDIDSLRSLESVSLVRDIYEYVHILITISTDQSLCLLSVCPSREFFFLPFLCVVDPSPSVHLSTLMVVEK